jgi:serine/threonine protein kinase
MPAPSTLDDLLRTYRAARDRGQPVTPQELCRDRPELLAEFLRRIEPSGTTAIPPTLPSAPASPPPTLVDSRIPSAELRPDAEPLPGYRLVRRLGKGGYGEVWEALAPGGFRVAFKFVSLEGRAGEVELQALEIIRNLRHPNLLTVFGTWQHDGRLLIGMELADATLHDELKKAAERGLTGLPSRSLARWALEAARVIDYLNKPRHFVDGAKPVGIQHGDIKPQNILLVGKGVKVGDFGLVRLLRAKIERHDGGMTPLYAAPEVLEGRVSRWSDQYSLAVTWCQLRGGALPFTGNSFNEVYRKQKEQPPDLSMLPEEERPAVARALASDPQRRWPDCRAFVKALAECRARSVATSAPPQPPLLTQVTPDPTRRMKSYTLRQAAAITLLLAAVTVYGIFLLTPPAPEPLAGKEARVVSGVGAISSPQIAARHETAQAKVKSVEPETPSRDIPPLPPKSQVRPPLADERPVHKGQVTSHGKKPPPAKTKPKPKSPKEPAPEVEPTAAPEEEKPIPRGFSAQPAPSAKPASPPQVAETPGAPAANPLTLTAEVVAVGLGLVIGWRVVRMLRHRRSRPAAAPSDTFAETADTGDLPRPSALASDTRAAALAFSPAAAEEQCYRGHADAVWSLALTPDGHGVVSGGMDHAVRLWDVHTLQDLRHVDGLADGVTAVTVLAGGRLVAFAGLDGVVSLWQPAGGELHRFTGHEGRIFGIAGAPDGRSLASCGEDGTVRIWEAESGAETRCLRGHAGWVYAVAYAGKHLLSAGADGTVRLWDASTGAELRRLDGHAGAVRCLGVSRDGTRAATGGEDRTVIVWDLAGGGEPRRLDGHTDWVRAAAWTPDGRRLVTGGDDETLCVWDAATGELVQRFEDTGGSTLCLAVTPDGRSALAGGDDGSVRIWELPVGP